MAKKATNKKTAWTCDVLYGKQGTKDLIADLKRTIESEESWRSVLEEKKRLEEELSAVRIRIIKKCINSSCAKIFHCKRKLAELEKPAQKAKKVTKRKRG